MKKELIPRIQDFIIEKEFKINLLDWTIRWNQINRCKNKMITKMII